MRYWLMKCEADVYSIADLRKDRVTTWEGVRNYQARNWLRDDFAVGDLALFYHSNSDPSGVGGIAKVVKAGYVDPFAFEKGHRYFDPDSDPKAPNWFMVDVAFVEQFAAMITLHELKAEPALVGLECTRRGSRLSIHPVSKAHFEHVVRMGRAKGAPLR